MSLTAFLFCCCCFVFIFVFLRQRFSCNSPDCPGTRLASKSQRSTYLCLLSAGIKGVCHQAWLLFFHSFFSFWIVSCFNLFMVLRSQHSYNISPSFFFSPNPTLYPFLFSFKFMVSFLIKCYYIHIWYTYLLLNIACTVCLVLLACICSHG